MQLTIRVGAAVDRSLSEAFRPVVVAANQAKAAIEKSSKAGMDSKIRAAKTAASAEEREYQKLVKQTEKWRKDEVRAADKAAKDRVAAAEKASKAEQRLAETTAEAGRKAHEKAERDKTRATEAAMRARAQNDTKAEKSKLLQLRPARAADVVGAASRAGRAAGGMALGIAGDLARGAGVETSFGSIVQKNFELQNEAAKLSNSGYMEGSARNGVRVNPDQLASQSMDVGKATGTDANEVIQGLQKFVAKTGDLKLGRDLIQSMAVTSKVTGAELSEMADAAGDVASNLEDSPDKAEKVKAVMAAIAAQGKLGAVEIKDLATQMAKLAAASTQFEGGAAKNMIAFGAMAQMSRQKGGASSAPQAANSISAWTATFAKGSRLDAFDKFGVKVMGANNQTRDQKSIILDSIRAANDKKFGGPANANRNMGEMFADKLARTGMKGWETEYAQAGGGEKGLKAVSDKYDELVRSTMSAQEANDSFATAMSTSKSQAEVFNQEMRKSTMQIQTALIPALVALAPMAVTAAEAFGKVAIWASGKSAITQELKDTSGQIVASKDGTAKAIASGTISNDQLEANKTAEATARKTLMDAKAEADAKKAEEYSPMAKGAAAAFDNSILGVGGRVFNKAFGSGDMSGIGNSMVQKKEQNTADATSRMEASEQLLAQALEVNKSVADRLGKTLVVRIEGGASGPPGIDPAGRTPPP